jgi:hypothetical protein
VTNPHISTLKLSDAETRTSRFSLQTVSSKAFELLTAQGTMHLAQDEVRVWAGLLVGDLVLAIAEGGSATFRIAALRVRSKYISSPDTLAPPLGPFVVLLDYLGYGRRGSVPWEVIFGGQAGGPPRQLFELLWESCTRVDTAVRPKPPVLRFGRYTVTVAQTHQDFDYINDAAKVHPFGYRQGAITLVARAGNQACGALVADYAASIGDMHQASWRVFRRDYPWLRQHALCVLRLYSDLPGVDRLRVHKALLQALITLGPSIVEPPLTLIEAVSYDYHPVGLRLGFQIEVPTRMEEAFYYWKPFSIPAHVVVKPDKTSVMKSVRSLRRERSNVKYWMARGRPEDIENGTEKSAWAIRRNTENTGRWRCLRRGHVVFLFSHDERIRACGRVLRTEVRHVRGAEAFPLWIDFEPGMLKDLNFDIRHLLSKPWFRNMQMAGLVPVPPDLASSLKSSLDAIYVEGKMWVEPNPYLLHRTEFVPIQNQVFVVQPWSLRETVFPVIKRVLSENGYNAVYAGDRDGQVIFDDVWLMLNESHAVVVDFTSRRPNVYLEYGMALVLGKPIVAITQNLEDIPSDTPNLKFIPYNDKLGDDTLERLLPRALRDTAVDIESHRQSRRRTTPSWSNTQI